MSEVAPSEAADIPRNVPLRQVLRGRVQPLTPGGELSAIAKEMVTESLHVGMEGIDGDEQANRKHHGGREKAVHHYPWEHYAAWRERLPACRVLDHPGAFGENFSTLGMTEENVCIGDIFRIGSAHVQVSQGRQPCRTLNARFGETTMARQAQSTGYCGWYYRVLEEGRVQQGDVFILEERLHPMWSVARLLSMIDQRALDTEILRTLSTLPSLAPSWQQLFSRRLSTGTVEDWQSRLGA